MLAAEIKNSMVGSDESREPDTSLLNLSRRLQKIGVDAFEHPDLVDQLTEEVGQILEQYAQQNPLLRQIMTGLISLADDYKDLLK